MNCFLYQLQFKSPVHFGGSDSALSLYSSEDHFRADTLFSALCHTALQMDGREGLEKLLTLAQSGKLLLSDAMPWAETAYYLPKPRSIARKNQELPSDQRKAMKKLSWLPVNRFDEYCRAVRSGELFACGEVSFGKSAESTKVMVPERGDAMPYRWGCIISGRAVGCIFWRCAKKKKWKHGCSR